MGHLPLIGVTTSTTPDGPPGTTPPRAWLNNAYLRAVQQAGGVPVVLPPHLDDRALDALWPRLDGILLTGGGDVDPSRFTSDARHPTVDLVSEARDRLEVAVTERALHDERPLLAICRGIQVLNVAWAIPPSDIAAETGALSPQPDRATDIKPHPGR